jgi:hypothetical protein
MLSANESWSFRECCESTRQLRRARRKPEDVAWELWVGSVKNSKYWFLTKLAGGLRLTSRMRQTPKRQRKLPEPFYLEVRS